MNPHDHTSNATGEPVKLDTDSIPSVEDFIRELEEKERDLHITADLSMIEVQDVDFELVESLPLVEATVVQAIGQGKAVEPPARTRVGKHEAENEVAALKMRVFELKNERNEIQQKSDHRLKEFENYRYRMDRERRGSFIDQVANLASQILPVLDNLNRAIDTLPLGSEKATPEFERLFGGIVLVNQQLNEVLAGMGVTHIASTGEIFDPNFHEAVATEGRSDIAANTVSEEILRGYRIGNKVVRHAMVKVVMADTTKAVSPAPAAARNDDDIELELDGTLAL